MAGLFCRIYSIFDGKTCWQNNVDPDQTPHDVASDLGLHCLSMGSFYEFPGENGLMRLRKAAYIFTFY